MNNSNSLHRLLTLLTATALLFSACSKDSDDPLEEDKTTVKTGVYVVSNLAADTLASSGSDARPLYFSLEQNKVIPESERYSDKWDICFTSIYNSSVYANNGGAIGTPGYGSPGRGGIYLVVDRKFDKSYGYDTINFKPAVLPIPLDLFDQAFQAVKTVPVADIEFQTRVPISLDHFQSSGDGWGYYDFYGSLFPDNPRKAHVVYTLPRAMIVRTAKGKYAKITIKSIYKDIPANPDRDNKPGYVSFSYAIQMDGSKNLDITP
ncbi:MAG: HmuY family protein [Candidatus Pseudobacter hemicellulosilyticus]|uniref:HmuY family protein n=1 Tax=Candidatus Pseudobacter hemicellulosilyticus TaxID=3121375 RepID=A0AAJ6BF35_9BACT|nr:MAG: HmuY family protein [Pseudobacter sp.]